MNDISSNPFLLNRRTKLKEYSLNSFLFREIAVERKTDIEQIYLAIGNLLSAHGFNIHLMGYRFLMGLVVRYIVKSDYIEENTITELADAYGTSSDFIYGSINASIDANRTFVKNASKTLCITVHSNNITTIKSVVEIFGALFKIYYNYTTVTENFDDELYAINYNRINIYHG